MTDQIKLIKGDCFILNEEIKSESVDLIVTDPPYGMNFVSNFKKKKDKGIHNDSCLDWLPDWFKSQFRILKNNCHAYVFCSWHNIDIFKKEAQNSGFNVKNILIWKKNNTGMGDLFGDYAPQYEMILFLNKGLRKLNNGRHSNIIEAKRTKNEHHPTEKPVNLIRFLIEKSSEEGELVLDNFFGSGSCAVACYESKRMFIGHEIDEERFLYSKNRVEKLLTQQLLF